MAYGPPPPLPGQGAPTSAPRPRGPHLRSQAKGTPPPLPGQGAGAFCPEGRGGAGRELERRGKIPETWAGGAAAILPPPAPRAGGWWGRRLRARRRTGGRSTAGIYVQGCLGLGVHQQKEDESPPGEEKPTLGTPLPARRPSGVEPKSNTWIRAGPGARGRDLPTAPPTRFAGAQASGGRAPGAEPSPQPLYASQVRRGRFASRSGSLESAWPQEDEPEGPRRPRNSEELCLAQHAGSPADPRSGSDGSGFPQMPLHRPPRRPARSEGASSALGSGVPAGHPAGPTEGPTGARARCASHQADTLN
ncbi:basic salivary proline-rich protein 2-like [Hyaena hyaena]|uniref:basic salivary proline-rich protein 2-like n=1 Tax=Hyaena hyaena TaxID=95912 RepID=UPI001921A022|nr:basic salivary proline-rich protein 2-like [Hyaena hyaena]